MSTEIEFRALEKPPSGPRRSRKQKMAAALDRPLWRALSVGFLWAVNASLTPYLYKCDPRVGMMWFGVFSFTGLAVLFSLAMGLDNGPLCVREWKRLECDRR